MGLFNQFFEIYLRNGVVHVALQIPFRFTPIPEDEIAKIGPIPEIVSNVRVGKNSTETLYNARHEMERLARIKHGAPA